MTKLDDELVAARITAHVCALRTLAAKTSIVAAARERKIRMRRNNLKTVDDETDPVLRAARQQQLRIEHLIEALRERRARLDHRIAMMLERRQTG